MGTNIELQQPHIEPQTHTGDKISREAALLALLSPADLATAQDQGLLDLFYYDPATGQDGLVHTLAGELRTDRSGAAFVAGFHHEPSGLAWGSVLRKDGTSVPVTRVEHEGGVVPPPMEPYEVKKVYVNGLRKMTMRKIRGEDGKKRTHILPGTSSMFPNEYDPLAVMQSIRIAWENRDHASEELIIPRDNSPNGKALVVSYGEVPLIDGTSKMRIRLVSDFDSGKIITAVPMPKESDKMHLTHEQMMHHVTGGLAFRGFQQ